MLNTELQRSYVFPSPEEPLRPTRPVRPINDWSVRSRRYTRPAGRIVRGGTRGVSRDSRSSSWREYGVRGRRDEVGLRGGRRGDWGIRGREIRDWNRGRNSYSELGWRERRRDDIGFRRGGMNIRGMHNERIRSGRGIRSIPRGPRGYRR